MDKVPAYLVVKFFQIRKHVGDHAWPRAEFESIGAFEAVQELSALHELRDLGLIALGAEDEAVGYVGGAFCPDPANASPGRRDWVPCPKGFLVLSRGRWLWLELACDGALWALSAAVGAVIGTAATMAVLGR